MKQTIKAHFSFIFLVVAFGFLIAWCGLWIVQEWRENSAPLPETKIIKPWTSNGYELLILTNGKSVKWRSSTPPIIVHNKESFLQKNISSVVLHYILYQNLSGGTLTYHGKTKDGDLILYKELLSSDGFTQGSNYFWKIRVNEEKTLIEFYAEEHFNILLALSSCCMFALFLLFALVVFCRKQDNKQLQKPDWRNDHYNPV